MDNCLNFTRDFRLKKKGKTFWNIIFSKYCNKNKNEIKTHWIFWIEEKMAQGKNKVKAKLPANVKHKSLNKINKQNSAFQKRKRK